MDNIINKMKDADMTRSVKSIEDIIVRDENPWDVASILNIFKKCFNDHNSINDNMTEDDMNHMRRKNV
ncbi:hypothetical protein KAR91_80315 [Candidatus Pacearchaeota archaeon]|nr:hypothetical protein [Candidatus Pacearchaeota archaeon]